jgi:hypothetical protein
MLKKMRISYNNFRNIKSKSKNILNEITIILKQEDGYTYNTKREKIKKHFPASLDIKYDKYNIFLIKEESKNRKISFSLSSNNITQQLEEYLNTAIRRYNGINMFNYNTKTDSDLHLQYIHNIQTLSILDFRHNLTKYDNPEIIKKNFPHFCDKNDRIFYDTIYIIKNENIHKQINYNNKTMCDNILICCNKKTFNIMFETDKINPYYNNFKYNINEISIKELFDDYNI